MRSPLALAELPTNGAHTEWAWHPFCTETSMRGLRARRVVLFREPTEAEKRTLELVTNEPIHNIEALLDTAMNPPWDRGSPTHGRSR